MHFGTAGEGEIDIGLRLERTSQEYIVDQQYVENAEEASNEIPTQHSAYSAPLPPLSVSSSFHSYLTATPNHHFQRSVSLYSFILSPHKYLSPHVQLYMQIFC